MNGYLGDFLTTETVYIPFHTFNADGASVTITGLLVSDIEVYKNGSITQRASDNGYALLDTDGIDFDGLTGIHGFSIDLSDNSDAGFYANGSQYWIVVSAVTVDAQTVSFVAGTFTIGRLLRPATSGRTLAVESDGMVYADAREWLGGTIATPTVTGVPEADVTHWLGTAAATPTVAGVPEVDATHVGGTVQTAGDLKASLNTIDDFVDSEVAAIKAVTDLLPNGGALTTIQADLDDIQTRLPAALTTGTSDSGTTTTMVDAARTEADTDYWKGSWIRFTSGTISGQVRLITGFTPASDTITFAPATTQVVGTQNYEILPAARVDIGLWLSEVVNALVSGRVDGSVGAMAANVMTAAATAADFVSEVNTQTGDSFARLGAPAGASISADIAVIEGQTNDIGVAGAGLTALGGMSAGMKAEVEAEVNDALVVHRLDELLNADSDIDGAAPPTVGSVVHELLTKTAGSFTYDQTTDSLEAIRDNMGTAQTGDSFARIGAAGAGLTDLGGMSTTMKAQVNTEVVDTLNVDTYAEPGQGAPPSTTTLVQKIGYLFKNWRNKKTQDATTWELLGDDAVTVDQKATVSDNGTDFVKSEIASGP